MNNKNITSFFNDVLKMLGRKEIEDSQSETTQHDPNDPNSIKLCIHCFYFRKNTYGNHKCGRTVDLVDGTPKEPCSFERQDWAIMDSCGIKGKYFKPRS